MSSVSLSNFSHSLTHVGTSGDTLKYAFNLGTTNLPVPETNGYDIDIDFNNMVSEPDEFIVDLSDSWLGGLSEGELTQSYNHGVVRFNIKYTLNNNNTVTGGGTLFELKVVRAGGFSSGESETTIGGGLVIVDNADFKYEPFVREEVFTWNVYPNPTSDYLHMNYENAEEGRVSLIGMDGSVMYQYAGNELPNSIDVRKYPAGVYFLSLEANGKVNTQKVVFAN